MNEDFMKELKILEILNSSNMAAAWMCGINPKEGSQFYKVL